MKTLGMKIEWFYYLMVILSITLFAASVFAQDWDRYKYNQGKKAQQNQKSTYDDMINQSTGTDKPATGRSGSSGDAGRSGSSRDTGRSGSSSGSRSGGGWGNDCCSNGQPVFLGQGCLDGSKPVYPCKESPWK